MEFIGYRVRGSLLIDGREQAYTVSITSPKMRGSGEILLRVWRCSHCGKEREVRAGFEWMPGVLRCRCR